MRFEKVITNKLGELLSQYMGIQVNKGGHIVTINADVDYSTDLFYEPLKQNPDGLVFITSVTSSTQTTTPDIDLTTDFLSCHIYCDENKKDELFKALDGIRNSNNAIFQQITDEDNITYDFQLLLTKPMIMGNPTDNVTELIDEEGITESKSFIDVQWMITAVYSVAVPFGADEYKVTIGSTQYTVNGLISDDFSEGTSDVINQYEGQSTATYTTAIYTKVYKLVFSNIKSDALCTFLQGVKEGTNSLYNKTITLAINNHSLSISSYRIEKVTEQGVSTWTMELYR